MKRFDRDAGRRVPFLSAMSMLAALDGEPHSYLEIADTLRSHGAARSIVKEVAEVTASWRAVATGLGLTRRDADRLGSAFEHEDLAFARRL